MFKEQLHPSDLPLFSEDLEGLSSTMLRALHPVNAGVFLIPVTVILVKVLQSFHPVAPQTSEA
jgi:hypothetical protein